MTSQGVFVPPQAKNVILYKNGDQFFPGRKFVINQRQILTFETFLNEVTSNINAPIAVRKIYTPSHGHRVLHLNHLQNGCHYVAAGFEKFKKLDYLQNGIKKPNGNRQKNNLKVRIVYPYRGHVSARWSKDIQMPCIINVFRNGDLLRSPFRLVIPKQVVMDWETVLALVTEKANLRTGAVRRLCTVDGSVLDSGSQLDSGQYYVAVGSEKFKHLPYLQLLAVKTPSLNNRRHRQMIRFRLQDLKKEEKVPHDGVSDSALLTSPDQSDHRRAQSTGDAAQVGIIVSPRTVVKRDRNAGSREQSVFCTKPVTVRIQRNLTKISQPRAANTAENPSVFKVTEKRAELQGTPEIPDDENTKVEFPVDQRLRQISRMTTVTALLNWPWDNDATRVAEIVQDEVIHEARTANVKERIASTILR